MKWIRLSEEKPPIGKQVIITDGSQITIGFNSNMNLIQIITWTAIPTDGIEESIYWMNMPNLPNNTEEK